MGPFFSSWKGTNKSVHICIYKVQAALYILDQFLWHVISFYSVAIRSICPVLYWEKWIILTDNCFAILSLWENTWKRGSTHLERKRQGQFKPPIASSFSLVFSPRSSLNTKDNRNTLSAPTQISRHFKSKLYLVFKLQVLVQLNIYGPLKLCSSVHNNVWYFKC